MFHWNILGCVGGGEGSCKGTQGQRGCPPANLSPICDKMKENEKTRVRYLTRTMKLGTDEI